MELESKAVTNPEIKDAFDEFLRAFEAFKSANDERLAQLERRSADVVTEEKVDRINRALDEQKRALDETLVELKDVEKLTVEALLQKGVAVDSV